MIYLWVEIIKNSGFLGGFMGRGGHFVSLYILRFHLVAIYRMLL
jgi:hypothetical protein